MSMKLTVALIIFSLFWICLIIYNVRHKNITIKYSLFWLVSSFLILIVGVFPSLIELVNSLFGFEAISNLIIGGLISILMVITFLLTIIVTKQKNQIKLLIQEVSLLKGKKD